MRRLIHLIVACAILFAFGCSQAERERQAVTNMAESVMTKVIDRAKIDTSNLGASGELENPMYVYKWFGGTGIYSEGSVQVIGVRIRASVAAGGVGESATVDQDLRDKIHSILTAKEFAADARKAMVLQIIGNWLDKKTSVDADGTASVKEGDVKTAAKLISDAMAQLQAEKATTKPAEAEPVSPMKAADPTSATTQ